MITLVKLISGSTQYFISSKEAQFYTMYLKIT